jgi:hypothetical protein
MDSWDKSRAYDRITDEPIPLSQFHEIIGGWTYSGAVKVGLLYLRDGQRCPKADATHVLRGGVVGE